MGGVNLKIPWTKLTSGGLQISADNISLVFHLQRQNSDDLYDPADAQIPLPEKLVRKSIFVGAPAAIATKFSSF